ncbi:MAG: uroporphyrinogen-III synthase [Betaproteobacteria bacterium]|nr:uroporphyrinogen-III synthase [Betaproteobacteria bacterium]MDE2003489.1 uroporphyrinogen-III synthase [Betaproteobacteria bacterium]MDE2209201.1 uroporphyrinogen-III synthase [Betaproteobacteria bacterium]MDE2359165.1 uroporphyrinogen-III synthase [Betaproteobacteria bacterium]
MDIHSLSAPPRESAPLDGIGVIVTRPQRQAAVFAAKIAALGGSPVIWPAIVILPPVDTALLAQAHAQIASYDIAVFVSANAVEYGAPPANAWPSRVLAFAPGSGTAEALTGVGITGARVPTVSHDSEGLLQMPELADLSGKRVVVFRGEGGREFLGNALRARGAVVDHIPCYRRVAPQSGTQGLVEAIREDRAHALTLTSAEGLDNLLAALSPEGYCCVAELPVFAGHPRIAERARERGLSAIETAGGDAGMLAGMVDWYRAHPRKAPDDA